MAVGKTTASIQEANLEDCPLGTFINYADTNYFSKIVLDYLNGADELRSFYAHDPNKSGLESAMRLKTGFSLQNRQALVENLRSHYDYGHAENNPDVDHQSKPGETSLKTPGGDQPVLPRYPKVQENIQALLSENTFTVTTAHQPNIFGGPLYLIYKILHVIQLAEQLNEQYREEGKRFVPFYYMGSEDADLEEIGQMQVDGKRYIWQTDQTGPVGRMKVDKSLLGLIEQLTGQIGVDSYGQEFISLLKDSYQPGRLIQEATFAFIHQLFGRYGLLILMPDDRKLKERFEPVVLKELATGFSHSALEETTRAIQQAGYKVQTHGRPINLFYQDANRRDRIIKENELFFVEGLDHPKTWTEIEQEVKTKADLFSGNVVLRGPFQETVLPDIAFIGGGGELAYWLEMKGVYEAIDLPYPVLILRNSFMLIGPKEKALMEKLGLPLVTLFKPLHEIQDALLQKTGATVDLDSELSALEAIYDKMQQKAMLVNPTLSVHTKAIGALAKNKATRLLTKMKSAQRKKLDIETRQVKKLKEKLFPGGNLQERTENIAGFYAKYGPGILDLIKSQSQTTSQQFGVIFLPAAAK